MRSVRLPILALLGTLAILSAAHPTDLAAENRNGRNDGGKAKISILDDCDPRDAGWAPTGGCTLRKGNVTVAEFGSFLVSPNATLVGHPAWQNSPSYLKLELGDRLRVKNNGGRAHTFTAVSAFGGGFIAGLNVNLVPAAACVNAANPPAVIPPGERAEIQGLGLGNHRFQCCIHPWMRTLVKVQADD